MSDRATPDAKGAQAEPPCTLHAEGRDCTVLGPRPKGAQPEQLVAELRNWAHQREGYEYDLARDAATALSECRERERELQQFIRYRGLERSLEDYQLGRRTAQPPSETP